MAPPSRAIPGPTGVRPTSPHRPTPDKRSYPHYVDVPWHRPRLHRQSPFRPPLEREVPSGEMANPDEERSPSRCARPASSGPTCSSPSTRPPAGSPSRVGECGSTVSLPTRAGTRRRSDGLPRFSVGRATSRRSQRAISGGRPWKGSWLWRMPSSLRGIRSRRSTSSSSGSSRAMCATLTRPSTTTSLRPMTPPTSRRSLRSPAAVWGPLGAPSLSITLFRLIGRGRAGGRPHPAALPWWPCEESSFRSPLPGQVTARSWSRGAPPQSPPSSHAARSSACRSISATGRVEVR